MFCVVADAAAVLPELQGVQGLVCGHAAGQGGADGHHDAPHQGAGPPVPHQQPLLIHAHQGTSPEGNRLASVDRGHESGAE